ncbi:hypothetical protein GSI_00200 [Ganoderma sinense ZZ0214-1]|uniref:Uncharacterized protein n=1 Tax=Ganoderma sinense ZZ0214-1 TaxID=1077348 RepID=A0A2G8SRV0_9APHY|nr:hypothetical protein GSI_00200 [Ganoderma sinense ZZ0214-1]
MAHCYRHPNLTRLAIDLNFILSTRLSPRPLIPFQARSKSTSTYLDQITRKLNFVCGELDLDTGEQRDSPSATGAVSKSLQDDLNLPSQPQLKLSTHYNRAVLASLPKLGRTPAYRQMQASAVVEAAEAEVHPRCDPGMRGMLGSEHRGANFSLLSALAQVRT